MGIIARGKAAASTVTAPRRRPPSAARSRDRARPQAVRHGIRTEHPR
jgi:hypothetical protein